MENEHERAAPRSVIIAPPQTSKALQSAQHKAQPAGCEVTISYQAGRPEEPVVALPKLGQGCEGAEVAISVILTAVLRHNFEPPEK